MSMAVKWEVVDTPKSVVLINGVVKLISMEQVYKEL